MSPPRFGVMLVNLGTPDAPTPKAVRRYLGEFLGDVRVIDLPRLLWLPILHGLVLTTRPKKVAEAYASVWTEDGSPLMAIGKRQRAALEARLAESLGEDIPVELAMTYGNPRMEEVGRKLAKRGADHILVLPLYPQFSRTTTAAVFDRLARALQPCPHLPELRFVRDYHDHPDYISALADSVRQHWATEGRHGKRLLMSYHGIPKRYATAGDPYPRQCERTSQLLAEALELSEDEWAMTYQSRFGKAEWLQPYTDMTLKAWGAEGLESVDVISPAFAADCLETLEELEEENRGYFTEAGGGDFRYIAALNDRPEHIDLLEALCLQHSQGW
ncbi:MAG: ferrochelatase [Cobetia crustatorum]